MRAPTETEQVAIDRWWDEKDQNRDVYEYVDNVRIAVVGNCDEERAYDLAIDHGCCGYCDVILVGSDGVEFRFGFNYGH